MPAMFRGRESRDAEEQPFWQQMGWQLSAAFVAVAVIGGGTVVALGAGTGDAAPAAAGPAGATVRIDAAPGSRPEGCATDDSSQSTPVRPPGDVTWSQLNGAPVPLSASAGPTMTSGPIQWCFAHTPMGAVMAANVIPRQMSGDSWAAVVDQQVVDGPGRDIFVAMRSSVPDSPVKYGGGLLAGFMLLAYSPEIATVRVLIRSAQVQAATDYTVAWSGGDWKISALASGDLHTPISPVSGLDGFIMWKV